MYVPEPLPPATCRSTSRWNSSWTFRFARQARCSVTLRSQFRLPGYHLRRIFAFFSRHSEIKVVGSRFSIRIILVYLDDI